MVDAVRAWWRYRRQPWCRRDYLRHFGYAAGVTFVVFCAAITTTYTAAIYP